jgi:hypothetical protein
LARAAAVPLATTLAGERRGALDRGRAEPQATASEARLGPEKLHLDPDELEREVRRKAAFLVATNVLDAATLPDRTLIQTYKAQSAVERGFAFLKDLLFLASSVFVKKPQRIMALAFIMVLCLLIYRLAEQRVRVRLAAAHETVPDQLRRPTARPTMRWLFQCFEGIDLRHMTTLPDGVRATQVLRLSALHRQVLRLLGSAHEKCYFASG